jgi:hypothetical protein
VFAGGARTYGAGMAVREAPRRRLSAAQRKALLTFHVVVSVGLLGDIAGFLVVAIRATTLDDPASAAAHYDVLATFSVVFGIPLSFATLLSGLVLGLGGKWGVLRYPWVTAKLLIVLSVILVGAFVLGPSVEEMRSGGGGTETAILAGASWDLAALLLATGLSVYKPGRVRRSLR